MSLSYKTRVVLLLDSLLVEKWMYEAIQRVTISEHSEIVQVVLNSNGGKYRSNWAKIFANLNKIAYFFFFKVDSFFQYKLKMDNARELVDLKPLLKQVPILTAKVKASKYVDRFHDTTVNEIVLTDPDVIVRFGFRILKGDILNIAAHGVWSYHHGDPDLYRGGPACFWEVVEESSITSFILQRINETLDGGTVLCESSISTAPFSPCANYNQALWSSVDFLERALKLVHTKGKSSVYKKELPFHHLVRTAPGNIQTFFISLRIIARIIRRLFQKLVRVDQWIIYSNDNVSNEIRHFSRFVPPKDRFWADPFPIVKDKKNFVFFEESLFKKNNAHISVGEIINGSLVNVEPVLIEDYHLSYPYLFEYNNILYMIPESSSNSTIDLYRCERFPNRWVNVSTLMSNIKAVDTTLLFHEGRWWLFAAVQNYDGGCPHSSLHIYWSYDLLHGDWYEHTMNPVVSDIKTARPAGNFFMKNEELYRVSQDCSVRYGFAINTLRVKSLTITEYSEELVEVFKPEWADNVWATHTYNHYEGLRVFDALESRVRIW